MTARSLFESMRPLVAPALEQVFERRDLCILATRVALDVAEYFGIKAAAVPVQAILYNEAFAKHVANGFTDVEDRNKPSTWGDGSWSVGIGCGKAPEFGRWDGHLIAMADGCFADFSIRQAERLQHNIYTGPALVGPYSGQWLWRLIHEPTGTVVEYTRMVDDFWRKAPDWKDAARRRPVVGQLIRALKNGGPENDGRRAAKSNDQASEYPRRASRSRQA
jgi:hypothetical protein